MRSGRSIDDDPSHRPPRSGRRLSLFQESFWYLQELDAKSGSFNVPRAYRLRGSLDFEAFEAALVWSVRRHDILRGRIEVVDAVPYQIAVDRETREFFETIDLSHLDASEAETRAAAAIEEAIARQFMFHIGPLVRAILIKISQSDHCLLVVKPHLVTDASSMRIFIDGLAERYTLCLDGRVPAESEAPAQFARYAAIQRESLSGTAIRKSLDYWRGRLRDAPAELDLGEGKVRGGVRTFAGAERWIDLPPEQIAGLDALADAASVTSTVVFLSAFALLLARKSGRDDLVVGTLVANRVHQDASAIIGPLVNTFALRLHLEGDPSIGDLLRRTSASLLGAYRHHQLPFERVVEELKSEKTLSPTFRLQCMFNFFAGEHAGPAFGKMTAEKIRLDRKRSQADLMLGVHRGRHGTKVWCEYNAHLYGDRQIDRFLEEYEAVLRGMNGDRLQPISRVSLLSTQQQRDVLAKWNNATARMDEPASWSAAVSAHASRSPDAVAIRIGRESLTFCALQRRSRQFARSLRDLGIDRGSVVGLPAEPSCDAVVAMIGCLESGCAFLPIRHEWPQDRVADVVSSVGLSVAFVGRCPIDVDPDRGPKVVDLAETVRASADRPCMEPVDHIEPDSLAFVTFVANSAATDGLAITHRAAGHGLHFDAAGFEDGRARDVLVCADTIEDALIALSRGQSVIGIAADTDPLRLIRAIAESGIGRVVLPLPALLAILGNGSRPDDRLEHVSHLFCRACDLPPGLAADVRSWMPSATLFNLYPALGVLDLCCREVRVEREPHVRLERPMPGTSIQVLDRGRQLAAVGVLGELYVGATGVSLRGLCGSIPPGKHVADPFGGRGARMMPTGERARRRDDGRLELLGRIEDQIEMDGFRFAPGEVEALLEADAVIRQAVVVAAESPTGARILVAYVVVDGAFDPLAIRRRLAERMPSPLVPTVIAPVTGFPRTASGELDRGALSRLPVPVEDDAREPRTATERRLARLFADVLEIESVGAHESFFELGGHSLLAMALVARIRKEFAVDLALNTLIANATVSLLAQAMEDSQSITA